jgi:hypothetical protein
LSDAAATDFSCFDSKWGSFKDRTFFALGDGDFTGRGSDKVYAYYGDRTGPAGKGYFSFDRGSWHIVVLNTTTFELGAPELTNAGSAFNTWLVDDLSKTTQPCIMAISWQRRFYTAAGGSQGKNFNMLTIANELYAAGVDVLVSANDHVYERFPQMDAVGNKDPKGFRQFIVGTGGLTTWSTITPTTSVVESQGARTWGVLKLTLNANSYEWEFMPAAGGTFTDKSTAPVACN